MLRPMILNRPIKLRARRTSPTRPALLVGPSLLLRGDKVRDPNIDRPRDPSPECGVLVATAVAITQSAISNPSSHRNGGLPDRVEYLSGALVMMTTASSNQTTLQRSLPRRPMRFFGAADRR